MGLIAIGLEYVSVMVPHQWAMAFAGSALQIERRNKAMNSFVVELIERLNEDGIYSLLIKELHSVINVRCGEHVAILTCF